MDAVETIAVAKLALLYAEARGEIEDLEDQLSRAWATADEYADQAERLERRLAGANVDTAPDGSDD